jgi:tRNA G18 (ribose-2'-O)-methylase SpoU
MGTVGITDPSDPRLDESRDLSDAELVKRRGIFIAEGRLVVSRLLASERFATRSVLVTEAATAGMPLLAADSPPAPVYVVPQSVMNGITGFNIHRGCLAVGERRPPEAAAAITAEATRVLVLERVANADNVGGIFRNAAALGAGAVLLDETSTDPLYRKAIRTSMATTLQVPFARTLPLASTLDDLSRRGFVLMALTPSPDATLLAAAAPLYRHARVALIVGHEGEGLTASTLAQCDVQARIPMVGGVDSLNVATATAIALYELGER